MHFGYMNFGYIFMLSCGYIIGSIPSGYWFAKYIFGIDITSCGSGNIGATNVARVLGSTKYFFLIFFFDCFKAWAYLYACSSIFSHDQHIIFLLLLSSTLLMGNAYSIFCKFNGGKGVATTVGILAALAPTALLLIFLGSWCLMLVLVRWAAGASISAMLLTALFGKTYFVLQTEMGVFLFFLVVWTVILHKENIADLFLRFFKKA